MALLIGGADAAWSADPPVDPLAGKWSLTYHLTTKPGHETYTNPASGQTVVQKAYVTHVSQPGFTVNPDGTFAFTAYDTGTNRNEHDNTSPGGAVHAKGKWQVYLKVSAGKVDADGDVVRLTLEQAFGNGTITQEFPAFKSQAIITTSPDSETTTQVTTTPYGTNTHQLPKTPGGYTPKSSWGSQKWELKKTSQEGTTTIYSAARDKQLQGGLLVVETVEVQYNKNEVQYNKKDADLAVSLGGEESHPQPGSTGTVTAVVSNNGPSEAHATLKVWVYAGSGLFGDDYGDSRVEVLKYSDWIPKPKVTVSKDSRLVLYAFTYQFTLPSGASREVKIEAKDTTPPGQTGTYGIQFYAHVTGDLPDPNDFNNYARRMVTFDPPKKPPAKSTPPKAK